MDTLVAILMVVLFLILLIFVFSTALLTPIIGKKNLLFVIFIGFMVGIVGGAFFIAPLYDDLPEMTRGFYYYTSSANGTIGVDVSTNIDITEFIDTTKKMDGVFDVYSSGIIIKTDPFPDNRKKIIEEKIPLIDPNITSWKIDNAGTITIVTKKGYNPETAISTLAEWLMFTGGINTKYSMVHVSIIAQTNKIDNITKTISQQDIVITGIEGPVEEKIQWLDNALPDKNNIIILCGIIGMLTGLAGVFIDTIMSYLNNLRNKIFGRNKEE